MGEFTDGDSPEQKISADHAVKDDIQKIETDVEGVFADGVKGELPVFDVDKEGFYQNMRHGRRRLRFKSGTSVQKYMQGTKYNLPFWIREPEGYIRKVK